MKHLSLIALLAGLVLCNACNNRNEVAPSDAEAVQAPKTEDAARHRTADWERFTYVPQSVLDQARVAWDEPELPAVTIAFSFDDRNLKKGWDFGLYNQRVSPRCYVGNRNPRGYGGLATDQNGFVFLEEEDLCGEIAYTLDNRRDQAWEAWCGPQGRQFVYEGEPLFVYLRLWCE